jgi:hypothetical protein
MTLSDSKNLGEWSELYVLARLLANGRVQEAHPEDFGALLLMHDIDSVRLQGQYQGKELRYVIEGGNVAVFGAGLHRADILRDELGRRAQALFVAMQAAKSKGLVSSLPEGHHLRGLLLKDSVAASAHVRNDLEARLAGQARYRGYSIKSQVHTPSSLLNASSATNFVYEVVRRQAQNSSSIPAFGNSHKTNIRRLHQAGFRLKFLRVDNKTFGANLRTVHPELPRVIGRSLYAACLQRSRSVNSVLTRAFPPSIGDLRLPNGISISLRSDASRDGFEIALFKDFLGEVQLGMVPATRWVRPEDDFGGRLLVSRDGDVLVESYGGMDALQSRLYDSLSFEQGVRSKHDYGYPYVESGRTYLKLNLQLRFKK